MFEIEKQEENLIEIKKSKFLSFAFPVENIEEIERLLFDIRKKYSDATHVCYAYLLKKPNLERCSDDGEPEGTAGKPMLELLKKQNITNILLVVVRYFGGVKLGAGGLVRAYTSSSAEVLKKCRLGEYKIQQKCKINCAINESKNLLDILRKNYVKVISQIYSVDFECVVVVENELNFPYKIEKMEKIKVFYDKN